MAIRQVRTIGDDILRKECKPIKEITPRIAELIEDMFETMYEPNGVGLAATAGRRVKADRGYGRG